MTLMISNDLLLPKNTKTNLFQDALGIMSRKKLTSRPHFYIFQLYNFLLCRKLQIYHYLSTKIIQMKSTAMFGQARRQIFFRLLYSFKEDETGLIAPFLTLTFKCQTHLIKINPVFSQFVVACERI